MDDEAFWDARYRSSRAVWSGEPNPQLVAEAGDLAPGRALDVGCGEGADALWLAGRGWWVTAVDVSSVALGRAAARAGAAGVRTTWVHADLTTWGVPQHSYDLVSAQFLHLPPTPRAALHARLAAAVASSGHLLVVGHHPDDLLTAVPRPPSPDLLPTADDVAAGLDPREWDVVVSEARARRATDREGRAATVHDAVLLARRR